jgi:hypothetical protein
LGRLGLGHAWWAQEGAGRRGQGSFHSCVQCKTGSKKRWGGDGTGSQLGATEKLRLAGSGRHTRCPLFPCPAAALRPSPSWPEGSWAHTWRASSPASTATCTTPTARWALGGRDTEAGWKLHQGLAAVCRAVGPGGPQAIARAAAACVPCASSARPAQPCRRSHLHVVTACDFSLGTPPCVSCGTGAGRHVPHLACAAGRSQGRGDGAL